MLPGCALFKQASTHSSVAMRKKRSAASSVFNTPDKAVGWVRMGWVGLGYDRKGWVGLGFVGLMVGLGFGLGWDVVWW